MPNIHERYDCIQVNAVEGVYLVAPESGAFNHYWAINQSDSCLWHERYEDTGTGEEGCLDNLELDAFAHADAKYGDGGAAAAAAAAVAAAAEAAARKMIRLTAHHLRTRSLPRAAPKKKEKESSRKNLMTCSDWIVVFCHMNIVAFLIINSDIICRK